MGMFDELIKDTKNKMSDIAQEELESEGIVISCTSCKKEFVAKSMQVTCPNCGEEINLHFEFSDQ